MLWNIQIKVMSFFELESCYLLILISHTLNNNIFTLGSNGKLPLHKLECKMICLNCCWINGMWFYDDLDFLFISHSSSDSSSSSSDEELVNSASA